MSTLLHEGGHRLEGRVAVDGNKNAALHFSRVPSSPRRMCPDEHPAHRRRRGDGAFAPRLGPSYGIGTTTRESARNESRHTSRIDCIVGRLRGSVRLAGPLARAPRPRAHRPPAAIFPPDARSPRTSRRSRRWARGSARATIISWKARTASGRIDVPLRGVVTERKPCCWRGERGGDHRDPSRRHRASCRRAGNSWDRWAPASRAGSSQGFRVEGASRLHGAEHRLGGDYIEAGSWAVVAAITGARSRSTARARKTSRSWPRPEADERASSGCATARSSEAVESRTRCADHDPVSGRHSRAIREPP